MIEELRAIQQLHRVREPLRRLVPSRRGHAATRHRKARSLPTAS
jgi:hypothetical protein